MPEKVVNKNTFIIADNNKKWQTKIQAGAGRFIDGGSRICPIQAYHFCFLHGPPLQNGSE